MTESGHLVVKLSKTYPGAFEMVLSYIYGPHPSHQDRKDSNPDLGGCNMKINFWQIWHIKLLLSLQKEMAESGHLVVKLSKTNPGAFEMVLSYIYTDRIHPTKTGEEPNSNQVILIMMDVYQLSLQVSFLLAKFIQNYFRWHQCHLAWSVL